MFRTSQASEDISASMLVMSRNLSFVPIHLDEAENAESTVEKTIIFFDNHQTRMLYKIICGRCLNKNSVLILFNIIYSIYIE